MNGNNGHLVFRWFGVDSRSTLNADSQWFPRLVLTPSKAQVLTPRSYPFIFCCLNFVVVVLRHAHYLAMKNIYIQICSEQLITGSMASLDVIVIASSCRLMVCNVYERAACFCVTHTKVFSLVFYTIFFVSFFMLCLLGC